MEGNLSHTWRPRGSCGEPLSSEADSFPPSAQGVLGGSLPRREEFKDRLRSAENSSCSSPLGSQEKPFPGLRGTSWYRTVFSLLTLALTLPVGAMFALS